MNRQESASVFVADFSKRLKERYSNSYWPKYLFHYADLENALSILSEDAIYSRNLVKEKKIHRIDSAGPEIISGTDPQFLDYARLYFRPRTPPLFRVEGFIPNRGTEKHCPLPIYFLFKWDRIFGLQGVRFSNGNLASNHRQVFDNVADLESMNFGLIYHDTFLPNDDPVLKDNIIKARCAEVIVPGQIPIRDNLFCIVCRSVAERETFLNLLNPKQLETYSGRTVVRPECFHLKRQYVRAVTMGPSNVRFWYKFPRSQLPFKYHYMLSCSGKVSPHATTEPLAGFKWDREPGQYEVELRIDDHLAYKGIYYPVTEPF